MTGPDAPSAGVPFVKGHGTENDFLLLPDPADALRPTAALVRALCDRRAGLGADGIIRIAPAAAGDPVPFVMDYRNADGSVAQMCGNGARVFARYLVHAGWASPGRIDFHTRGGVRTADVPAAGDVTIAMGPAAVGERTAAWLGGDEFPAVAVDVGNPHAVCFTDLPLDGLDLGPPPRVDPAVFPEGVNVEFVTVIGEDHLRMRVHERGVGETRSCGTGTVAVAAAWRAARGGVSRGAVRVDVPGGSVRVVVADDCLLTGPAVLVASGVLDPAFWNAAR